MAFRFDLFPASPVTDGRGPEMIIMPRMLQRWGRRSKGGPGERWEKRNENAVVHVVHAKSHLSHVRTVLSPFPVPRSFFFFVFYCPFYRKKHGPHGPFNTRAGFRWTFAWTSDGPHGPAAEERVLPGGQSHTERRPARNRYIGEKYRNGKTNRPEITAISPGTVSRADFLG